MDLGLRDKIVLVTGGAKGIGAATVKAFLAEDCKVVIVDRDTEAGPALAKSSGSKVTVLLKPTLQILNPVNKPWNKPFHCSVDWTCWLIMPDSMTVWDLKLLQKIL